MNMRNPSWIPALAMSLALILPTLAHAQAMQMTPKPTGMEEPEGKSKAHNMAELKFGPIPGMPTCLAGAVKTGDPFKGPG